MIYSDIVKEKSKILIFGFIDMNAMDGSAVFLSSLVNTLSLDSNLEIDLLLARPVVRDILVKPLYDIGNVNIINPYEDPYFKNQNLTWVNKGFLNYEIVEDLITHYYSKNNYDWIFVRSIETVEKLLKHEEIMSKTMVYITGLAHSNQEVSNENTKLLKDMYAKSAMFFCQTHEMKDNILNLLKIEKNNNRVNVLLPMVPDVDININRSNKKISKIVYTGKFDKNWRSIEIISAFKELKREFTDLTLEIAGDKFNKDKNNPYFQEELIYLLKNTTGVTWHGAVPRSFAQNLIIRSDIGITWRSEEMDSSLELSTKLLEYGTFKKAVIMNPTEMHIKLFGSDYPLYAVTEKDFREALKKSLTNPEIYEFAAQRMHDVSTKFTFSNSIKNLQPLIWGKKVREFITREYDETKEIYLDPSVISSELLSCYNLLPKNLFDKGYKEINIIVNLITDKEKVMFLNKISKYGRINIITTIGSYNIINVRKYKMYEDKNIEYNAEFYNHIGACNLNKKTVRNTNENILEYKKDHNELTDLEKVKIIQQNSKIKKQLDDINKKFENLQRKYNALSNSKLGKITLKYWKNKNKKRKLN